MRKRPAILFMATILLTGLVALSGCKTGAGDLEPVVEAAIPVGSSPSKGAANPKVTIVGFSSFQCGYCGKVKPTIDSILAQYPNDVKYVFKHNPLSFQKNSPMAAEASIEADTQGKFWEMHDKLFENITKLDRASLDKYAEEIGLDMAKFRVAMDSRTHKATWEADQKLATELNARGTPAFFINGVFLSGAQPIEIFKKIIDSEIAAVDNLLKDGTSAKAVYAKRVDANKGSLPQAAKKGAAAADNANVRLQVPVTAQDATKGPADALVTIVEFSEFQCPFCSRVNPTIKQVMDTYGDKVRVVFKHNPLPFHKDAPMASQAALAAGKQGKFWEMHDKLFENAKALQRENLETYASQIGLDMAQFKKALDEGTFKAQVAADMALASKIGANGTPNFFINGKQLVGAQPFDNFKKLIDEELKNAEEMIKKGTPKASVYETLMKSALATAPKAPRGGDAQAARPQEDPNAVYKVPVGTSATKGSPDALITIVEFSEFQCPFCSRVLPTIKQINDTYGNKVRVVFKHNPLPFHKDAPMASQAAMAAGEQGKFWEMHDLLFDNNKALSRADLEKYASQIGLNMAKFKAYLDGEKGKTQIESDQTLARSLGASGTPTFFINGRKLRGAQPFDSFKKMIDEELVKAEALVKKGIKPADVYAEVTKNGAEKAVMLPSAPAARPTAGAAGDNPNVRHKVEVGNAPTWGPANAKVTIVEWSDYECPYCGRGNDVINGLKKEYGNKIQVAFKHNPLSFHKNAPFAAEAAMAAHEQGKFWEMSDVMFKNSRALDKDSIFKYAKELGLDMNKFKASVESGKWKAHIEADQKQAAALGAGGTPTFFINGKMISGAQPIENFKKIIDEELAGTAKK